MKRLTQAAALLLVLATLTACSPSTSVSASNLTANIQPMDITAEAAGDFAPVGNLGIRLLNSAMANGDQNAVISPLSAYICLTMAMNGADGDTLTAFEEVMGADTYYANLICRTAEQMYKKLDGGTELSIACSAWSDESANINEDYLKAIVTNMEAEVYQGDLSSGDTMKDINGWVNKKTSGLIPMLRVEPYPDDTMLVLLNALYMDAEWQWPFEFYATHEGTFTAADGEERTTDFMNMTKNLSLVSMEGAEGVLLPYKYGRLAFLALLPDGGVVDLTASLTAESMQEAISTARDELLYIRLPKFDIAYERLMTNDLAAMGLETAFDPDNANFTPMGSGPNGELYLSTVFQKVRIRVDEEGTEAAAVTEIEAAEGAAMIEPIELLFNRPFLYGVVDTQTGLPLFLGAYDMPA